MIETFVDYALGPHGRYLSELYLDHQLLVNTIVIGIAMYKLFFSKRKQNAEKTVETK
jgi:hypothetical protein